MRHVLCPGHDSGVPCVTGYSLLGHVGSETSDGAWRPWPHGEGGRLCPWIVRLTWADHKDSLGPQSPQNGLEVPNYLQMRHPIVVVRGLVTVSETRGRWGKPGEASTGSLACHKALPACRMPTMICTQSLPPSRQRRQGCAQRRQLTGPVGHEQQLGPRSAGRWLGPAATEPG